MSKRTIIISVVAVICFVAALFSLFLEKQAEINGLQNIIDGPEEEPILKVVKKKEPKAEPIHEIIHMDAVTINNDGSTDAGTKAST